AATFAGTVSPAGDPAAAMAAAHSAAVSPALTRPAVAAVSARAQESPVAAASSPLATARAAALPGSADAAFDGRAPGARLDAADSVGTAAPQAGAAALRPASALSRSEGGLASIPSPARTRTLTRGLFAGVLVGAAASLFSPALIPALVTGAITLGSILLHETAHLLGLRIWGDPTPRKAGRDSLNPLRQADLWGTIVIPFASLTLSQALFGLPVLLGWAKPVPVDFNRLKDPKRQAAYVAALGPATNLALAGLAAVGLFAFPALGLATLGATTAMVLMAALKANLALAFFNLLPLPWLDGGKIAIALLPKSLYKVWTHNPNVRPGYQRIFQKIYEGPSNVLSLFRVTNIDQVNWITRLGTLMLVGTVSAVFFASLGLPFLFLALPCSYDYWCIREKVRSEKAVEDMMGLMSEWGALLVQLADEHDAQSEVSAFEAEHAMKNAVDQLLEDLWASEEFRGLTHDEQVARFMKAYPDMAVRFLKEKVFPHDGEDKIRAILADPKNDLMYARLQGWLQEHRVFEVMKSPHAKKDGAEGAKKADENRAGGAGGSAAAFALLPLFALGAGAAVGGWAAAALAGGGALLALGLLAGFGPLDARAPGGAGAEDKLTPIEDAEAPAGRVIVLFQPGMNEALAQQALARHGLAADEFRVVLVPEPVSHNEFDATPTSIKAFATAADAASAAQAASALASEESVVRVGLTPAALAAARDRRSAAAEASPAPGSHDAAPRAGVDPAAYRNLRSKLRMDSEAAAVNQVVLELGSVISHDDAEAFAAEPAPAQVTSVNAIDSYRVSVRAESEEAALALALAYASDSRVTAVVVRHSLARLVQGAVVRPDAAMESEALVRIRFNRPLTGPEASVLFMAEATDEDHPVSLRWSDDSTALTLRAQSAAKAAEAVRAVVARGDLEAVEVHPALLPLLSQGAAAILPASAVDLSSIRSLADLVRPVGMAQTLGVDRMPAASETPAPEAPAAQPTVDVSKFTVINNEGEFKNFMVRFAPGVSEADARAILSRHGVEPANLRTFARNGVVVSIQAPSKPRAISAARGLSLEAGVAKIPVRRELHDILVRPAAAAPESQAPAPEQGTGAAETAAPAPPNPEQVLKDARLDKFVADADKLGRLTVEADAAQLPDADAASGKALAEENPAVAGRYAELQSDLFGGLSMRANTLEDAARVAAALSADPRVERVRVHPDALAELNRLIDTITGLNPLTKASTAELPDRKDARLRFKKTSSDWHVQNFFKKHVLKNAAKYEWEDDNTLRLHARDMDSLSRIVAAAAAEDDDLPAFFLSAAGKAEIEERRARLGNHAFAQAFAEPDKTDALPDAVDEPRGLLVRFKDGTSPEAVAAYSQQAGARLVENDYRGSAGLALFELPKGADMDWILAALRDGMTPLSPEVSIEPLKERPAAPAAAPVEEPAQPATVEVPRRDAHAEWIQFLQSQVLQDGKSKLNPGQVGLLAAFLKPVQPPPNKKVHPIIGRVEEMKRVTRRLTSPRGGIASAGLVGPAGTG
ncbi:MAG TPA: site-2 protease family protein, partial [Elusimicrobiota bacterium]|nr:site-2 protease family protein [Elusimicrobiota bacterium]